MLTYLLKRLGYMVATVFLITAISFFLIQLPPGDFLSSYLLQLQQTGAQINDQLIQSLRTQYGLDKPMLQQYLIWMRNIVTRGDFGRSFGWQRPVNEIIWGRIGITVAIGLATLVFVYLVAIPVGIYSALRKYSFGDFFFTTLGYVGLAIPGFVLALAVLYGFHLLGYNASGLNSNEFLNQPMSWAKMLDTLKHAWIAIVVMGVSGIAGLTRVMRGMLLDELGKQYVTTARAKGLSETRLVFKYPVRLALNPVVATIGWSLAGIISGAPIVEAVLNLPTTGSVLLRALQSQDMYLAGAFILLLSVLTVVGTFLSDILLALFDPRIRMEK